MKKRIGRIFERGLLRLTLLMFTPSAILSVLLIALLNNNIPYKLNHSSVHETGAEDSYV